MLRYIIAMSIQPRIELFIEQKKNSTQKKIYRVLGFLGCYE